MDIENRGVVFDIQRYSLHDGPGIRTVVFLKGCPLRCAWCCNPESQKAKPQLSFMPARCIGCGDCVMACPKRANTENNGRILFDQALCIDCGMCAATCYSQARKMIGQEMTVDQVMAEVVKDRRYYENSHGGVTLSGGEMAMQWRFSAALLQECHRRGLHTAVETTGYAPWEHLRLILKHTDLILYDLKHMDSEVHRRTTGVGTELIHENLRHAAAEGRHIIVRLPLIPGVNDGTENLTATASFAREIGVKEAHVLPYHRLGVSKYALIGYHYTLPDLLPPGDKQTRAVAAIFEACGLNVRIDG